MNTQTERQAASLAMRRAITVIGNKNKLAKALGIRWQAVHNWEYVPDRRVLAVEALTGGQVTRHELRPDLYPLEE